MARRSDPTKQEKARADSAWAAGAAERDSIRARMSRPDAPPKKKGALEALWGIVSRSPAAKVLKEITK